MDNAKPFRGTLKNAFYNSAIGWVEGNIYGHPSFPDGTWIHTSRIAHGYMDEFPDVIETLNSRYSVEWEGNTGTSPNSPPVANYELLEKIAQQFVFQYAMAPGEVIDLGYYASAFNDALKKS